MDKEFLENYQAKEDEEYYRLVVKKIEDGTFDFERDKYPHDNRFVNLKRPMTDSTIVGCEAEDRWNQVPFSGSTTFMLTACPQSEFEQFYFDISQIQKVIDFIKETGKIQIVLQQPPELYVGLDYLDPLFIELNPPQLRGIYLRAIGTEKEFQVGRQIFYDISSVTFSKYFSSAAEKTYGKYLSNVKFLAEQYDQLAGIYAYLRLTYPDVAEELETALVVNPNLAICILGVASDFLQDPAYNLRFDSLTHSFDEVRIGKDILGKDLTPKEIMFPGEVGKFLLNKLTYAPKGIRACNELIDHYDSYDLQKVNTSLNLAILDNHPDLVEKNVGELSEILDNVWNDETIPKRIKGLKIGIPVMFAAIGSTLSMALDGFEGLFAKLGFAVTEKLLANSLQDLDSKISKKFSKNYQVNIYDFKKKYENNIVK